MASAGREAAVAPASAPAACAGARHSPTRGAAPSAAPPRARGGGGGGPRLAAAGRAGALRLGPPFRHQAVEIGLEQIGRRLVLDAALPPQRQEIGLPPL